MKEIKIKVKGMHCEGCEKRIKNSLGLLDEIENVIVSFTNGEVTIKLKKEINLEIIKEQIEDLGFEVIDNEKSNS